jgi:hypothetical protein
MNYDVLITQLTEVINNTMSHRLRLTHLTVRALIARGDAVFAEQ